MALFLVSAMAHFSPSRDMLVCASVERRNEFGEFVSTLGGSASTARVVVLVFDFSTFGSMGLPAASKRFFIYQDVLQTY